MYVDVVQVELLGGPYPFGFGILFMLKASFKLMVIHVSKEKTERLLCIGKQCDLFKKMYMAVYIMIYYWQVSRKRTFENKSKFDIQTDTPNSSLHLSIYSQ